MTDQNEKLTDRELIIDLQKHVVLNTLHIEEMIEELSDLRKSQDKLYIEYLRLLIKVNENKDEQTGPKNA